MATGPFSWQSLPLLSEAVGIWKEAYGYTYIDLPWFTEERFAGASSAQLADVHTSLGILVSSGEQSFLKLWVEDRLPEVLASRGYIGWTPCFRAEPKIDEFHQHGFLKAEIFAVVASREAGLARLPKILAQQQDLFMELAAQCNYPNMRPRIKKISEDQFDLLMRGIEIGSYGVREFAPHGWYLYGTALALPRFTQSLSAELQL